MTEHTPAPCSVCAEEAAQIERLESDMWKIISRMREGGVTIQGTITGRLTPHNHTTYVPGCYRCDLSRAEATPDYSVETWEGEGGH